MKNAWKKSLPLILVPLSLSLLASCSEEAAEANPETPTSVEDPGSIEEIVVEPEEEVLKDNLPELNFNGETLSIYYPATPEVTRRLDAAGDMEGDVVDAAVYNRNLTVDERLNISLNFVEAMTYENETGFPQEVHKLIMAGDSSYDLVLEETAFCFQYMLQGDYREISRLPYLELEQPWWFKDFMEKGMIQSDRKYYLTGAAVLSCFARAGCTHFNKAVHHGFRRCGTDLFNGGRARMDV